MSSQKNDHRHYDPTDEWLETDGLGGFAGGTVSTVRTRRYHGLLNIALSPPTCRTMLVNGADVFAQTPHGTFPLSAQRYVGGAEKPETELSIESFESQPWPKWTFSLPGGTVIEQEFFLVHETNIAVMQWKKVSGGDPVMLTIRPLLSGRDHHALHAKNDTFRFDTLEDDTSIRWKPYDEFPTIVGMCDGTYVHDPHWYENFFYQTEEDRGFDACEDLGSTGFFRCELNNTATCIFSTEESSTEIPDEKSIEQAALRLKKQEYKRRSALGHGLQRAADHYIVRRGEGKTIVAGYPWFTDWGRDTFISMRGLCLATGRLDDALDIMLRWAQSVSAGMLPNRFTDENDQIEFNAVDASLWYVIVTHELLEAFRLRKKKISSQDRQSLLEAADAILNGYLNGTRYGIHADDDGLILAGQEGVQLTWMDAKVGEWVVTPRRGKPVEVQALWLNALWAMSHYDQERIAQFQKGLQSFNEKFWNEERQCLYDVIDADHQPGANDDSFRPNQIFAIGGLLIPLVEGNQAKKIVDAVEQELWTPLGMRTLDEHNGDYHAVYQGNTLERDGAYHQGTAWPWLTGAFVDAWLRIRGNTEEAKKEAQTRFLCPLLEHLDAFGIDHICEIADAQEPHIPRGCPFQAWSVGEAIRISTFLSKN